MARCAGPASRPFLQILDHAGARRRKRRSNAAKSSRGQSQHQRESHHNRIHRDRIDTGQGIGQQIEGSANRSRSQSHANRAPRNAQHQSAQHRLPQDRARWRAERHLHRIFAPPPDRPHQQQPRNIGACYQQHHQHCHKQRAQQRPGRGHRLLSQRQRVSADVNRRHARRKIPHDLLRHPIRVLRCLTLRHPILQPRHHAVSPRAHVLLRELVGRQAQRNPHLRLIQSSRHQRKLKASRHHPDNRIRLPVQHNGLPQHSRIAMVPVQPQRVADYRQRLTPVVFLLRKHAPQHRRNAQRRKCPSSEPRAVDQLRRRVARQLIARPREPAHRRERIRGPLIRRNLARCHARIRPVAHVIAHDHQPVRIGERQRPQQDSLHQREDRDGRAHAERQR